MKTLRIIIPLVLTFIFNQGSAQSTFGFKGGYTNAWPDYGDIELPEDAETQINGVNFSLFYFYKLPKNFSVGIAPGYIKRGAACVPGWEDFIGDTKFVLNYIELPLMVQKAFQISKTGLQLNCGLGYGASRLISAYSHRERSADPEIFTVSRLEVDGKRPGSLHKFDHGAYFNSGLSYDLNNKHSIFFESSFYYGLKGYDTINGAKNRSLNFNLGYGFLL